MEELNRMGSPMLHLDESLNENVKAEKRRELEDNLRTKSPFQIGTMDDINEKICRLDERLKSCTHLRYDRDNDQLKKENNAGEVKMRRVHEIYEVTKFAGIYSMKATFGFNTKERVKKIAKISTKPKPQEVVMAKRETDTTIPKFIELYQFPGYDETELTPLPEKISPVIALDKAMRAHPKPITGRYRVLFTKWLFSNSCQSILQDMFWYYFLLHYGTIQDKLEMPNFFSRAAKNYANFLSYVDDVTYRNVFLTDFPDLLSQALFAAFSDCFPDSYSQFGLEFKEELIGLVYSWLTGIKPLERLSQGWNIKELQPESLKHKEEKKKQMAKVDTESRKDSLPHLNNSSLSQFDNDKNRRISLGLSGHEFPSSSTGSKASSLNSHSRSSSNIKYHHPRFHHQSDKQTSSKQDNEKSEGGPVIFEEAKITKESHPVGPGPTEVRCLFNLNGHSPAMQHFLKSHSTHFDRKGKDVLIHRTELRNLPPLDSETYHDIISQSSKRLKEISKEFRQSYEESNRQHYHLQKSIRAEMRQIEAAKTILLSHPKRVRELSNYIVLERLKDPGTISIGADGIVQDALNSVLQE